MTELARRAMNGVTAAAERLRGSEMLQVLVLFLAAQLFVVAVRWPGAGGSNEVWFGVAPTRLTLLALSALGFGAAESARAPASRRATAGALLLFAALSEPFDAVTYAASYPAAPLWWAAGLPYLEALAYLGLGMLLGHGARRARIGPLLPLLVPGLLVLGIWADVRLGVDVFNPVAAALAVSPLHAGVMLALAAATVYHLARAGRREPQVAPGGEGAA